MRINVTSWHALLDYGTGSLLLIGPWLFGFSGDLRATLITQAFGVAMIGYSLYTDYEPSFRRKIPLWVHLGLEMLCGGLLIGTPWMFSFSAVTWIPHLVIGTVTASRPALLFIAKRLEQRIENSDAGRKQPRKRTTAVSR
ncbi:MAG: hypothetical protein K8U03_22790 [Planctomycetia bacterium]|nr:hypothetical protein [Planctomycetia bacterium]